MGSVLGAGPFLLLFVVTALVFNFLNGFNDSASTVATLISSRAMSPRAALLLSAVANFAGPFLFGVAVATTIGREVIAEEAATIPAVLAALVGAIGWNLITWLLGIPSSSSHALVGGLVGAAAISYGFDAILLPGLGKILVALFVSPIAGMLAGYLLMKTTLFLARGATPRINMFFRRAQVVTATALALSHGTNDAQKTMGIITMGLLAGGVLHHFHVPTWVIIACAGAMALGTMMGGWRIIHTLGGKFYKIRPIHGFTSQIASATVILVAALVGGPVSTTHVVSSAILGVGAAERVNKVRWTVVGHIVTAWLLTIPAAALMAMLSYTLIERLF
ncbi:MAG TPA: inorganic phosphate transporter [Chloroflexi bacterium]|nr:inorganic phosphate transporter [Chloroflexota bacterium]